MQTTNIERYFNIFFQLNNLFIYSFWKGVKAKVVHNNFLQTSKLINGNHCHHHHNNNKCIDFVLDPY